jgi:N utilization substance protein A
MTNYSVFGSTEMLQIADSVARDKGINRDAVIEAMEQAIQIAGRRKYGHEHNIKAEIDRKTGEIKLYKAVEVVETVENDLTQITLDAAKKVNPELEIGDFIKDPLPPIDLAVSPRRPRSRSSCSACVMLSVTSQFEEYKDRVGEIISGTVKRVEYGHVTVDLGRMRRVSSAAMNSSRVSVSAMATACVRICMMSLVSAAGPQIFLSRTRPEFMMPSLFAQEVPEIYDGIVEIRAVARDPGSRAKIAVLFA